MNSRSSSPDTVVSLQEFELMTSGLPEWVLLLNKEVRKQRKIEHFQRERIRVMFAQKDDPLLLPHPLLSKGPKTL